MADQPIQYNSLRSYANIQYLPKLVSQLYTRSPLLAMIAARGGGDSMLRVGAYNVLGGNMKARKARRAEIAGSYEVRVPFQTSTSGGSKWMGARDTAPQVSNPSTNSQDQKRKTAFFKWSKLHTEVVLWNTTTELAKGKYALASAVDEALQVGMEDHTDQLIPALWWGNPTSQTDDIWDAPLGIYQLCSATNVYGGIDRSLNSGWAGRVVSSATTASLAIIDDANITQGVTDKSLGINTVLCSRAVYLALKAEALTKNGTMLYKDMPQSTQFGITSEAVQYGNVIITFDPWLKDYTSSGGPDLSKAFFGSVIEDLVFETQAGYSFQTGPWIDQEEQQAGGADAKRAIIKTHPRFYAEHPWQHILYTNVS